MAKPLEMQAVRCSRCDRYLCSAFGLVEVKCSSCKTLNRVSVGDLASLARRTAYGSGEYVAEPSDTVKRTPASLPSG